MKKRNFQSPASRATPIFKPLPIKSRHVINLEDMADSYMTSMFYFTFWLYKIQSKFFHFKSKYSQKKSFCRLKYPHSDNTFLFHFCPSAPHAPPRERRKKNLQFIFRSGPTKNYTIITCFFKGQPSKLYQKKKKLASPNNQCAKSSSLFNHWK